MGKGFSRLLLACLSALVTCSDPSFADSPETSGKTVTVYVGSAAGSGYDAYARFFARHLGRHLPGRPSVVVANMPGANSIACANFLYNVAPKDGSALAILLQNVAEGQVIGHDGIRYDAAGFGWVGRLAPNVEINYVWHTVPVKSIDDLRQREAVYAAVGTGTASAIVYPTLLNAISGTRIKLVRGYQGTPNALLRKKPNSSRSAGACISSMTAGTSGRSRLRSNWFCIMSLTFFAVRYSGALVMIAPSDPVTPSTSPRSIARCRKHRPIHPCTAWAVEGASGNFAPRLQRDHAGS